MGPASRGAGQPRRRRRGWRIAAICAAAVVVLAGATVVGGLAVVSNLSGHIQRIHVAGLDAVQAPGGGPRTAGINILITGAGPERPAESCLDTVPPGIDSSRFSGLIDVLHINADQRGGGDMEFQPNSVVPVPGVGRTELWYSMLYGGPSLLVKTLEKLTGLHINYYARVSFKDTASLVDAIGGIDVGTPLGGGKMEAGTLHLNGEQAVAYVRDGSVSQSVRVARQSALIRAADRKIGQKGLLSNPMTMWRVLHALTRALTLSSNITTRQIVALAKVLGGVSDREAHFLTVPYRQLSPAEQVAIPAPPCELAGEATNVGQTVFKPSPSRKLFEAASQDALAGWAQQNPRWVVPGAVP